MFPEAKYPPVRVEQRLRLPAVPLHVLSQLAIPERSVARWPRVVFRASVPEAAVYEDGELLPRKSQVRTTTRGLVVEPVSRALGPEGLPQRELGGGVLAPDSRHVLGAGKRHGVAHRLAAGLRVSWALIPLSQRSCRLFGLRRG